MAGVKTVVWVQSYVPLAKARGGSDWEARCNWVEGSARELR